MICYYSRGLRRNLATGKSIYSQIAVASTELGLLEMVKSGTTSFSDMFNPIG